MSVPVLALSIGAAAAVLSFRPIYEPDLGWHLAQGREAVAGRLVRTNVFSFAYSDYRQHYTPWLFDVAAYVSWTAGGGAGVQLMQASLLALSLGLLYAGYRARAPAGTAAGAAAVLIIGFFILEPRALPRPHLVSFAGMAACTLLLERASARRTARPLWLAIPLVALWSNFHVECVFGVVLVGIFAASELVRPAALTRREASRACVIAAASAAATLANPYGWGLLAYLRENWSVPSILRIAELEPPPLVAYRAFYVYLATFLVLLVWRFRSAQLWHFVAGTIFALLGLRFLRLTPLLLFVTAPFVAASLSGLARRSRHARALLFAGVCIGLLVSRIPVRLLATELSVGSRAAAPEAFFSSDAIAFIRQAGLRGPVFNSPNLGGYLAWNLHPDVRIFQDSRLQAYPPEHFLSILVASRSQADWDVLVADVGWAVLSLPRPNQLSGVGMFPADRWTSVFRDEAVEVVVRRGTLQTVGCGLTIQGRSAVRIVLC